MNDEISKRIVRNVLNANPELKEEWRLCAPKLARLVEVYLDNCEHGGCTNCAFSEWVWSKTLLTIGDVLADVARLLPYQGMTEVEMVFRRFYNPLLEDLDECIGEHLKGLNEEEQ